MESEQRHTKVSQYQEKARVLIEAMPYMQSFRGETFVIKVGGSAMENGELLESLFRDIVFMEIAGINPVIVHGGGKAISAAMDAEGLRAEFVHGLRVTSEQAIAIVEKTLDEKINPHLVSLLQRHGGRAVGVSGKEVFVAEQSHPEMKGEKVDLGYVGQVNSVVLSRVEEAISGEIVPVVSPLGWWKQRQCPLNINADLAASALARALQANKLIYLSDVVGICRDPGEPDSLFHSLDLGEIDQLIAKEVISGGMLPKVESAAEALREGEMEKVHFIDGRLQHSLLLEIFTDMGVGTEIVA